MSWIEFVDFESKEVGIVQGWQDFTSTITEPNSEAIALAEALEVDLIAILQELSRLSAR